MPVPLTADDQELLREEVRAFAEAMPDGDTRLGPLAAAVNAGSLPDEALDDVGAILEAGFQTGRIRRMHRAPGEQALLRLYGKTPAGAALATAVSHVNKALAQLEGQTIESVRLHSRLPGVILMMIGTDSVEMTLRFGPEGPGVESVAVGV